MSKLLAKRPDRVDLAKPRISLQPQQGVRKLTIKNLRPAARQDSLDQYYGRAFEELQDALGCILDETQPQQPFERLYRNVEDLCRHGKAKELFSHLRKVCDSHLQHVVLQRIDQDAGSVSQSVLKLKSVHKQWLKWQKQSTTIRSIFSYLDRAFLLNQKDLPQINDMTIALFRRACFKQSEATRNARLPGPDAIAGMCELVEYDRRGDPRFDSDLLKDAVSMVNVLNIYGKHFEPKLLSCSRAYFTEFAEERSAASLKSYITACEGLLAREDFRCNVYNLDSTTKRQLMDDAHNTLIVEYTDKLLDDESLSKLLDENETEALKALYELLRLSSIQKRLKEPWTVYIKAAGSNIVNDTARGEEMVVRLLLFRRTLDIIIRDAFDKDADFLYSLKEAFGNFINDKKVLASWKTGTSKVGEMIAKHIDLLLRGGLKTLPKSLLSDSQDRADAEKSGQASTGDEDAELDRQLDQALELFRFIQGKDVFEAFYKQDLARRLLMSRSASADAERSMLTKLKSECGSSFTHNLEQMFKDQALARDEMTSYKAWREGNGHTTGGLDLSVNILSAAAWPTYPDTNILLPDNVASQVEQFDKYYVNKHTGRRLTWKHSLAHCVVKARFNKGPKELLVSAYQAVVLTLFNQVEGLGADREVLTYQKVSEGTGLTGGDLDRTLQSLACGKSRVLTKSPKGKEVNPSDTFVVNKAFVDAKYRVKINQIQLKETKEENQATHERVAQDRQFETQAAIVRIMKSRKTMTHAELVAEVINQTKSRGAVDTAEIKKNIEKYVCHPVTRRSPCLMILSWNHSTSFGIANHVRPHHYQID